MKLKLATFGKLALLAALLGAVSIPLAVTQATVSSTSPRNDYVGTGSVSAYDYTFRIFANSDLRVTTQTSAGVVTALVLTTDYTVTGANNPNGGTITLVAGNLASGTTLTIRSDRTPRQDTNLRNQGSFSASTHETKFDELTRYAQQLRDVLSRSIHFPETETGTDASTTLPSATLRASKFLAFDGSGNVTTASGTSANLGPVSSYIDTLLDDASASAARTTLGAVGIAGDTMTGNLAISTSSLPKLTLNTSSGSNKRTFMDFQSAGTTQYLMGVDYSIANTRDFFIYDSVGLAKRLGIDSNGVVEITAGQLKFPATENASADVNTLDDYKVGTWTPSVGGNATYTTQTCTFVKIGRLFTTSCNLVLNVIGTGSTSVISGMPCTPAANTTNIAPVFFSGLATNVVTVVGRATSAGTTVSLMSEAAAGTGMTAIAILGNASTIQFTLSFPAGACSY